MDHDLEETPADVDMNEELEAGVAGDAEGEEENALPEMEEAAPPRFLDYLKSPIVELSVGTGVDATQLSAHQALLTKSPYLAGECAKFDASAPRTSRRIGLPNEDLEAMGSLLEYLYHGEYFPKRLSGSRDSALEADPSVPSPDDSGVGLLKHARVYTLAGKFGFPALKSLAHSKIHRTSSTARGEIAYARYVYSSTDREDSTIRRPVAAFWATRSHVLRHEAEAEFRGMCLEYPQFGFDVLSLVLDQKEKSGGGGGRMTAVAIDTDEGSAGPQRGTPGSTRRKRARVSEM